MEGIKLGSKRITLGKVKEKMQTAQQEFASSWKTIAEKAKKEAKIVNRKARKALATEDGGNLRESYILTVNLDVGYDLFKRFQENWARMHNESVSNVKKAEEVEYSLGSFVKDWERSNQFLNELHGNLVVLPEVIAKVEIVQNRIESIGKQTKKIEELILEYEDACERFEFEMQKLEMKYQLSQLCETKQAEYTMKKSMMSANHEKTIIEAESAKKLINNTAVTIEPKHIPRELERQQSQEKQKAYQDAFMAQMDQYIQYGELEKPIAGFVADTISSNIDDIQIEDSDWSTLSEFLGPEELDSVKQAEASQRKKKHLQESRNFESTDKLPPANTNVNEQKDDDIDCKENTITTEKRANENTITTEKRANENTITTEKRANETDLEVNCAEGSDNEPEFFDAASETIQA